MNLVDSMNKNGMAFTINGKSFPKTDPIPTEKGRLGDS